ncbi:MAG: SRPBCC family protein [Mycobacteriales bacterium]
MDGTVNGTGDGRYELRFERALRHPVERVWAALTRPERLAGWLAACDRDLGSAGEYTFRFEDSTAHGTVTRAEPPTLLEYTWSSPDAPESLLRWELRPDGDAACTLVLTQVLPVRDRTPELAAGWHSHLDALAAVLAGGSGEWQPGRWRRLRDRYAEAAGLRRA